MNRITFQNKVSLQKYTGSFYWLAWLTKTKTSEHGSSANSRKGGRGYRLKHNAGNNKK